MVYLGIDFGTKRIGVAMATDETPAVPLKTLEVGNWELGVGKIIQIAKEENVDIIVVGRPGSMKGSEEKYAIELEVDKFITQLKSQVSIPVVEVDERLTSKSADSLRREFGASGQRDAVAAMLILEAYLSRNSK